MASLLMERLDLEMINKVKFDGIPDEAIADSGNSQL